jgi:transcriptional regulator with XRE-family HTH domain
LPFCYVTLKGQASKPIPANYPSELKHLGDHLQKKRLDLGLQWKQLAALIGIEATTVANWWRMRTQPALEAWPAIIAFLEYDPRPAPATSGQRLKQHREGHGLSQKAFAAVLSVDPSTLARWERDARHPEGEFLRQAREVLAETVTGR